MRDIKEIVKFRNLGTVNQNAVTIGNLTLYFSYNTIVGFEDNSKIVCSKNAWSKTTGKLLNKIEENKNKRLEYEEFLKELREAFIRNTLLGKEKRVRGLKGLFLEWLGNSQHLWMWDYKSIKKELEEVGFKKIRRAFYGDYENINFKDVENYERWKNCLGVECQK